MYVFFFSAARIRRKIVESSILDWSVKLFSVCSRSMGDTTQIESKVKYTKRILYDYPFYMYLWLNGMQFIAAASCIKQLVKVLFPTMVLSAGSI